tara:strand:- start:30958 stop:31869 length:912 start_codon:yes stop_codon:yes gene_type:complete
MTEIGTTTDATMIGLGPMGLALAELLLTAGKSLAIWNRTPSKAAALKKQGATWAETPADAIKASPVIFICVYDYAAADAILATQGVAEAVKGRLVINLGTGSPDDAKRIEAFVTRRGGSYLDAAIQAAPSQMGQEDTPILISGPKPAFAEAEPVLKILAGKLVYLGEDISAAASMDLSTLSYVYGAFAGFLHGARIAEASGVDVAAYGELVNTISPSFGAFFGHEGRVIASEDYRVTESPLRISVPAIRRILTTSQELGLNTEVPALMDGWLQKAREDGLEDQEVAALIKVLRRSTPEARKSA